MVDPVHPEVPEKAKARLTVTSEFDLDPDNYKGIEWPPGSGVTKDLITAEEMLEFERQRWLSENIGLDDLLDLGNIGDDNVTFELVPPSGSEPFDEDESTYRERHDTEPRGGAAHLDYPEDRAAAAVEREAEQSDAEGYRNVHESPYSS